jgi:hypothetical protein
MAISTRKMKRSKRWLSDREKTCWRVKVAVRGGPGVLRRMIGDNNPLDDHARVSDFESGKKACGPCSLKVQVQVHLGEFGYGKKERPRHRLGARSDHSRQESSQLAPR